MVQQERVAALLRLPEEVPAMQVGLRDVRRDAPVPPSLRQPRDGGDELLQAVDGAVGHAGADERGARRVVAPLRRRAQVGEVGRLHVDIGARVVEAHPVDPRPAVGGGQLREAVRVDHEVDVDVGVLPLLAARDRADDHDPQRPRLALDLLDIGAERPFLVLHAVNLVVSSVTARGSGTECELAVGC